MPKCPYTFPDRSRKAMTAYLAAHAGYVPMNTWNGGFVLAWNIKVHNVDYSGKSSPVDYPVLDRFDSQWDAMVENDSDMFFEACGDATECYTSGDWTNYPGIEQGEWKFGINGRSGGYMILTGAPSWLPAPRRWKMSRKMSPMIWESRGDYQEWLGELDTPALRRFYRAVRVLDYDLSPQACAREVAYHFAARRHDWEQERLGRETRAAECLEASRPDMYGQAS